MTSIFYFIVVIFIAYGLGKQTCNLFTKRPHSVLEDFTFSIGLGLALLGYIVYMIGSLGFLYQKYILLALSLCFLIAIKPSCKFIFSLKYRAGYSTIRNLDLFDKFLVTVILFIPFICLFGALAPETGNDALAYHLYHPKVFVENHKIGYIPFTRESLWPFLTEMLFTLGLLFESIVFAKLTHYFFGILSTIMLFVFANRFFSRKAALLSAALFYCSPGIFMQSAYAYIDLSLCFYSLAALYCIVVWSEEAGNRYFLLSAVFTGLTLSVKYVGGFVAGILAVMVALISIQKFKGISHIAKHCAGYFIVAFIISCVWYVRSFLLLHNPVYPFLNNIFPSGHQLGAGSFTNIDAGLGLKPSLIGFLRLPWDLAMHPDLFGGEQIGVILIAFLPFLFLARGRKKCSLHYLFFFLICYSIAWFWTKPLLRIYFVNYAVVFMLISAGFLNTLEKYRLSGLTILLSLCIGFNVSYCVFHYRDALGLSMGKISSEQYLFKKERSYPIAEFVNKNTPSDSVIIVVGEPRVFYFDRKVLFFDMWKTLTAGDIHKEIQKFRTQGKSVFLVYREDSAFRDFNEIRLKAQKLFSIVREVDKGINTRYTVFAL